MSPSNPLSTYRGSSPLSSVSASASYLRLVPTDDHALRRRLRILAGLILVGFCILLARAWHLQVRQGAYFLHLSEQNRLRHQSVKNLRGNMLDRQGRVLATNRPTYDLMATPEDLPPEHIWLPALQRLDIHPGETTRQSLKTAPAFKPSLIQPDITRDQVAHFVEHRMAYPGFFLDVAPLRSYSHGPRAAHLLGYLGQPTEAQLKHASDHTYAAGTLVGQYGLEQQYETILRGRPGSRQVEVDTFGRETQELTVKPPIPGDNLILSLDLTLQQTAEQLLEHHTGSIIALDPRNGQILALASHPTFDPNTFTTHLSAAAWSRLATDPAHPLHNRAIQGQYAPGSLFKIVTALAILEEGIATPHTTVCCTGKHVYGRRTYHDWKRTGHGCVDLYQALVQSCDIYFYHMGEQVGVDRLAHYAKAFGLGTSTGLIPGLEQPGLVPSRQWKRQHRGEPWYGGETLSIAIGQGYTLTTPVQIANLMAAVANGGTLYRPYVVLRQERMDGEVVHTTSPTVMQRLNVQPGHLDRIKQSLWGVVHDPHGTGNQARHDHIAIAGKTATVQVVRLAKNGRGTAAQARLPKAQRDHAWFAAFAPMNAPRIVVVIMIEHAGTGGSQFASWAKTLIQTHLEPALISTHIPTHDTPAVN